MDYIVDIHLLKCFGSTDSTGSEVLIIENDDFTVEERLRFTQQKNKVACVFMTKHAQRNTIILDYYYPHTRSPLCLHGTLAASYVYFLQHPNIFKTTVVTQITNQKICVEVDNGNIFLKVTQQHTPKLVVDLMLVQRILNTSISNIIGSPAIVSVGSPKLLIEVNELNVLNSLNPDLELIIKWSKENFVSGCYVYHKLSDNCYIGRNFNHLDPVLEDVATGVAAGAITAHFKRDINLYQGALLNNQCIIHTKFENGVIFIGGKVTYIS